MKKYLGKVESPRLTMAVPILLIAQKLGGERFNLRKLNELEVRKQYQIEITNSFTALENLSDDKAINRAWENIKENIKTSAIKNRGQHELKQHKHVLMMNV